MIDKAIIVACCLANFAVLPLEAPLLVALLCSVAAASLAEVMPPRFASLFAGVYAVVALVGAPFAAFLPVVVYDLARDERQILRFCWVLPAMAALMNLPAISAAIVLVMCAVAFLLSYRTQRTACEQVSFRRRHDDLQEASLALEAKNRNLHERQDMEVRLATLAERARIAREIHDNVGHLLTRSIMQVEALQVVHRGDEVVRTELAQVGTTLHEAMDTVRSSVHDLHDDAFDLRMQMISVAQSCTTLAVTVQYQADDIPLNVGYCFVAIVREALSNAARHSDASKVIVSVVAYPAFYRLVVHDNGTVPPRQEVLGEADPTGISGSAARGMGLAAMSERTRALGGRFRVDYDHGFKVFVSIPREVLV